MCVRLRGEGLEDRPHRRRDDHPRRRHDPLRPVLEAHGPRRPRVRRRRLDARPPAGAALGEGDPRASSLWGIAVPLAILVAGGRAASGFWPLALAAAALVLLYPLQVARIALRDGRRRKLPAGDAWAYAASVMVGKFAQAIGAMKFWTGKLRGRRSALIEYKAASPSSSAPVTPLKSAAIEPLKTKRRCSAHARRRRRLPPSSMPPAHARAKRAARPPARVGPAAGGGDRVR